MTIHEWDWLSLDAAAAFIEGITFVNDSDLEVCGATPTPNADKWTVCLHDRSEMFDPDETCPYCGCSENGSKRPVATSASACTQEGFAMLPTEDFAITDACSPARPTPQA